MSPPPTSVLPIDSSKKMSLPITALPTGNSPAITGEGNQEDIINTQIQEETSVDYVSPPNMIFNLIV